MRKYVGLFFILTMMLSMGVIARAEDGTTSRDNTKRAELNAQRQKMQDDLKMKRQEVESQLLKLRQEREKIQTDLKMKRDEMQAKIKDGRVEVTAEMRKMQEDLQRKREEIRTQVQEKRAEIQTEIETTREMAKQKMEDLRAQVKEEKNALTSRVKEERIVGREKALERFDGAIFRVNNLKERVNEHIAKLEAKGVDVTEAINFVAIAESKLGDAQVKIVEANNLLSLSIEKLTKENKTQLVTLMKDTQSLIKEAHRALIDAVKSLKESVKVEIINTTTEPSTNTDTDTPPTVIN